MRLLVADLSGGVLRPFPMLLLVSGHEVSVIGVDYGTAAIVIRHTCSDTIVERSTA